MSHKIHHSILCLTLFMLAIVMMGASVVYADPNKAAFDERGQAVRDSQGNCVRTKWTGDLDPCAPPPPPPAPKPVVKAPPPPPRPVIKLEQRTIFFDFDSAQLTEKAVDKLDYLAQTINASRAIADVHIVGYADEIGSDSYNQALSEERVAAVEEYLDRRSRMDTKAADIRALGEAGNMEQCDGLARKARIECLQPQRKVEVEFKYQPRQ